MKLLKLQDIIYAIIFLGSLTVFLFYLHRGLSTPYSYWLDELWSVTTSNGSAIDMFRDTFYDVHPPLYQAILWLWISIFGSGELATRALSAVFAALSVLILLKIKPELGTTMLLALALLIIINPNFHYYAQETRSYSLLLFASSVALTSIIKDDNKAILASAVFLALVHFFGTLMGVFLCAYVVLKERTLRAYFFAVLAGAFIVAWPVAQALFGQLSKTAGGNFWIKTSPLDSMAMALKTISFPIAGPVKRIADAVDVAPSVLYVTLFVALAVLFCPVCLAACKSSSVQENWLDKVFVRICLIVAGFISAVALISIHTPVATKRNYIILVPFFAYILAYLLAESGKKSNLHAVATGVLLLTFTWVSSDVSRRRLEAKMAPLENWRATAEMSEGKSQASGARLFHFAPPWNKKRTQMLNIYLSGSMQNIRIDKENLADLQPPYLIMFGRLSCDSYTSELLKYFDDAGIENEKFLAPQHSRCLTGYIFVN